MSGGGRRGRRPGPRIRSIKPETWQDEKIGRLSDKGRLLFIGLITLADDEGRFRALPAAVIGHTFPYDEGMTATRVRRLLAELEATGIVVLYECDGVQYGAFRHWRRHQRIDRPTPSELPPPPDPEVVSANAPRARDEQSASDRRIFADSSSNIRREIDERSSNARRPPRAGARPDPDPDPDPDPSTTRSTERSGSARASRVDQMVPPRELAAHHPELAGRLDEVLAILAAVQTERGGAVPTPRGVGLALIAFPRRDHVVVARELQHWALAGRGQTRPVRDWVRLFRAFLERAPEEDPARTVPPRAGGGSPVSDAIAEMQQRAAQLGRLEVIEGRVA